MRGTRTAAVGFCGGDRQDSALSQGAGGGAVQSAVDGQLLRGDIKCPVGVDSGHTDLTGFVLRQARGSRGHCGTVRGRTRSRTVIG